MTQIINLPTRFQVFFFVSFTFVQLFLKLCCCNGRISILQWRKLFFEFSWNLLFWPWWSLLCTTVIRILRKLVDLIKIFLLQVDNFKNTFGSKYNSKICDIMKSACCKDWEATNKWAFWMIDVFICWVPVICIYGYVDSWVYE